MAAEPKSLHVADERSCALLDEKARKLEAATHLLEAGVCQDRAHQALIEAAAILRDAARDCRRSPNVPGIRES